MPKKIIPKEKIRESFDVSVAQQFALDTAKSVNDALWWNDSVHLRKALASAESCVKALKAAKKACG